MSVEVVRSLQFTCTKKLEEDVNTLMMYFFLRTDDTNELNSYPGQSTRRGTNDMGSILNDTPFALPPEDIEETENMSNDSTREKDKDGHMSEDFLAHSTDDVDYEAQPGN